MLRTYAYWSEDEQEIIGAARQKAWPPGRSTRGCSTIFPRVTSRARAGPGSPLSTWPPAGEAVLASALAVAFGALLRRTLPAIGAAVAGFTVLLLAARWMVQALTPASKTTGPHFTAPPGSWILGSGTAVPVPYHPAGQYWPLQLILLTILLAFAAAALATGWHATPDTHRAGRDLGDRTRAAARAVPRPAPRAPGPRVRRADLPRRR